MLRDEELRFPQRNHPNHQFDHYVATHWLMLSLKVMRSTCIIFSQWLLWTGSGRHFWRLQLVILSLESSWSPAGVKVWENDERWKLLLPQDSDYYFCCCTLLFPGFWLFFLSMTIINIIAEIMIMFNVTGDKVTSEDRVFMREDEMMVQNLENDDDGHHNFQ